MKLQWVMVALLAATLLVVRAHGPPSVSPSPTPFSSLPSPHPPFPPQDVDFWVENLRKIPLPPQLSFLRVCAAKCQRRCREAKLAILHRVCMGGCLPIECHTFRSDAVNGCALECMAAAPAAASAAGSTSAYDEIDGYNENCFRNCAEKY